MGPQSEGLPHSLSKSQEGPPPAAFGITAARDRSRGLGGALSCPGTRGGCLPVKNEGQGTPEPMNPGGAGQPLPRPTKAIQELQAACSETPALAQKCQLLSLSGGQGGGSTSR